MEFLKSDMFLFFILAVNILLVFLVIMNSIRIKKVNDRSKEFMRKLGNGKDIQEDLNNYMQRIIDLEEALSETHTYCKKIEKEMENCVQKVGVVRYNAYKDAGKDLSFAVALLDEKNNGVVFNGIYSREMSNIYAKPVEAGKSTYTLIKEEEQAIEKAINFEKSIDK